MIKDIPVGLKIVIPELVIYGMDYIQIIRKVDDNIYRVKTGYGNFVCLFRIEDNWIPYVDWNAELDNLGELND